MGELTRIDFEAKAREEAAYKVQMEYDLAAFDKLGSTTTHNQWVEAVNKSRPLWSRRHRPYVRAKNGDEYAESIVRIAMKHNINPILLDRLIATESNYDPNAVGEIFGEKGLAQFREGTAKEMGIDDPFDPEQAIDGAARYLKKLFNHPNVVKYSKGDPARRTQLAIAAYNAGGGTIGKWKGNLLQSKAVRRYAEGMSANISSTADGPPQFFIRDEQEEKRQSLLSERMGLAPVNAVPSRKPDTNMSIKVPGTL